MTTYCHHCYAKMSKIYHQMSDEGNWFDLYECVGCGKTRRVYDLFEDDKDEHALGAIVTSDTPYQLPLFTIRRDDR